jgi:hypothetical protein
VFDHALRQSLLPIRPHKDTGATLSARRARRDVEEIIGIDVGDLDPTNSGLIYRAR